MDQQMGTVSEILGANGKWGEVQITLAGKTYTWKECGRRAAREMLARLHPILIAGAGGETDPVRAIRAINEALDFFYEFHQGMRADKAQIDGAATNKEVLNAVVAIQGLLNGPFVRDQAEAQAILKAAEESEPKTILNTKPESSNG